MLASLIGSLDEEVDAIETNKENSIADLHLTYGVNLAARKQKISNTALDNAQFERTLKAFYTDQEVATLMW